MKQIKLFEMRLMHNNEFSEFLNQVDQLINATTVEKLGISTLYPAFTSSLKNVSIAMQVEIGSSRTLELRICNTKRNRSFRGIKLQLNSLAYHYNPTFVEAARVLSRIFEQYGNLNRKSINEKSSALKHLIEEITSAKYFNYLKTLNLDTWVQQLYNENEALQTVFAARADEISARPDRNVLKARQEAEPAFAAIVNRINALAEVNGSDNYALFIDQLNLYSHNYKTAIKNRKKRRKERKKTNKPDAVNVVE
jgi:hypothetical protein